MIPPEDLEISLIDRSPKGGQQAGSPHPEIKVLHKPTRIYAVATARSQHKARAIALSMVEYGLLEAGWTYNS